MVDSPRIQTLKELHADEITEDVADSANVLIGKAVHALLAKYGESELDDNLRLFMDVTTELGTWTISGQPDRYHNKIIGDYKTPGKAYSVKFEYEAQTNVYKRLLEENGYEVEGLELIPIQKSWTPFDKNTIPASIVVLPIRMWSREEADQYIIQRVYEHQRARIELPLCGPNDRWQDADKYKVMPLTGTRAIKGGVFETEEEAKNLVAELGEDYYVQFVAHDPKSEIKRCVTWSCAVFQFCEQGQMLYEGVGG